MFIYIIAALLLLGTIFIYLPFRSDIREAYKRVDAFPHKIIQTDCGKIDTALRGEGIPVLISHGIAGGYDQGLGLADAHLSNGMMAIAPSRFGYQSTSMPDAATPAMQADAFACLLDALDIPKAVVMANSAGGTSAIQFALRHPDRVKALVLVSSAAPSVIEAAPLPPKPVIETVFRSDLVMWLITSKFQKMMLPIVGVPKGYALNANEETLVSGLISSILPIRPRQAGFVFDMFTSNKDMDLHPELYPLENISVPTLVIHAQDDPLAWYENAQSMAARIPTAELFTIPSGGHLMLGSGDSVKAEIERFIRQTTGE